MTSTTITSDSSRFLDDNNRLSSAGAAASLKYASPKDLPSYPSAGLPSSSPRMSDSAAGAAASLGWANQKRFEHWKPSASTSATTAATVGWNRKSIPPWQPQQSANGARAALLAAKADQKVDTYTPKTSAWGNSAANVAMRNERTVLQTPLADNRSSKLDRRGSLIAATGAMSGPRKRADSTPDMRPRYPDDANARSIALRAATHAENASRRTKSNMLKTRESPTTNLPKEKTISRPPPTSVTNERNRADSMHASAIAMAQQMHKTTQKRDEETAKAAYKGAGQYAAASAHGKQRSTSLSSIERTPMNFSNLHEAAQKLAQERLAKLHDEQTKNREYRDYYGSSPQPISRLLSRGRFRRRASSDASLEEDEEQTQKIQAQMSMFSSNLTKVDSKARQRDRDALLAVAQQNVARSLQGMDERVYEQTGRMAPAMMSDWEARAKAIADEQNQSRMDQDHGRISIGGGAFVEQSTVDAVALKNVQPVLDEIATKTEAERAHQAELKMDEEENKRLAEIEKTRNKELKEVNRKLKERDKQEDKARRSEEKASKAQNKRMSKQSAKSRESEETAMMTGAVLTNTSGTERMASDEFVPHNQMAVNGDLTTPEVPASQYAAAPVQSTQKHQYLTKKGEPSHLPPTSPKGVKGWLKTAFHRTSKGKKEEEKRSTISSPFIGGASLTKPDTGSPSALETADTGATPALETADTGAPPALGTTDTGAPPALGTTDAGAPPALGTTDTGAPPALGTTDTGAPPALGATDTGTDDERTREISVANLDDEISNGTGNADPDASTVSIISSIDMEEKRIPGESDGGEELEEARDQFNEDSDVAKATFSAGRPSSPRRDSKFHEAI